MTKARDLAELIGNSLIDGDEIATGAVGTSNLAATLDFSSKTMVMADNQLSGDKIHGGTVSAFTSTGIDDNATLNILTVSDTIPLHIKKAGSTSAVQEFLRLENSAGGGAAAGSSINFHHYHSGGGPAGGAKAASITAQNMATWPGGTPSSYSSGLTFGTLHENTFAERMRIHSSGKIGIGETGTPDALLHLKGGTATGNKSHIIFENTQGSKVFAVGGGADGVNNSHLFVRNVTDNTTPMVITDGGALGLGVIPGAWSTNYPALQIGQGATFTGHKSNTQTQLGQNWWIGTANQYVVDGAAARMIMNPDSTIIFSQAPSGLAGATMSTVNTRLIIKPTGNVGIGSSDPSERLHVHSATDTTIKITDQTVGDESYGGYVKGFSVGGSGGRLQLGSIDNNVESLAIEIQEQANGIHFNTKNGANGVVTRRLSILGTSGNVGIGIASPTSKLHVDGPVKSSLVIASLDNPIRSSSDADKYFTYTPEHNLSYSTWDFTSDERIAFHARPSYGNSGQLRLGKGTDAHILPEGWTGTVSAYLHAWSGNFATEVKMQTKPLSSSTWTDRFGTGDNGSAQYNQTGSWVVTTALTEPYAVRFAFSQNSGVGSGSGYCSAKNITITNLIDSYKNVNQEIYHHNGNVGIGTTIPAAPLDFGVTSTNQQVLLLRQNGNSRTGFSISNDYGVRAFGPADASSTGSLFGVGEMTAGTNYLGDLFTVRYDGKVGIGTTSPDYALQVSGPNVPSGGGLATVGIYDDTTPYDGTLPGGGITFRGKYTSNNAITNFATVQGIKENATDGDYDTALRFTTRSNGSNLTEKVRISSSGNVGIGTLIPDAKLHVNGPAIIGSNNNNATTPIAGLHVLDNSYGRWSTTLSKEQVALRVETYWNAAGGQRAVGTYGGGIGFNHLGGHSLTHDENVHAWIGPRVVATPGHETSALVFATNNVTNDEDAGLLERASISPEGRFTFKQTSTNPSQIHNSVGYTDLYKFSFSMSMMGNQAYVIRTSGHSNGIFKALAFGSHWTMTYGLYRESYISLDSVTNFTEDNLHNRTSSQQGGITFSRHSAGEIDIVKSAGTYAGSMFFNIIMYSPRNINVVGIY